MRRVLVPTVALVTLAAGLAALTAARTQPPGGPGTKPTSG